MTTPQPHINNSISLSILQVGLALIKPRQKLKNLQQCFTLNKIVHILSSEQLNIEIPSFQSKPVVLLYRWQVATANSHLCYFQSKYHL